MRNALFLLLTSALFLSGCLADDSAPEPGADVRPPDATAEDVSETPDVPQFTTIAVTMTRKGVTGDEALLPAYPHLTWQDDPATTATVQWRVFSEGLEGYTAKLWFARADEVTIDGDTVTMPHDPAHVVELEPTLYEFANLFEFFYFAEAEMTGLEPDTRYVYRAGTWDDVDEATGALVNATVTPLHSFRTGLMKGSDEPFSFVAAGDSRGGYDRIAEEAERLHDLDNAFWLFSGDMTTTGMPREWDTWFEAMGPLVSDNVLMPVPGNHESWPELFYALFALPRSEELVEANPELGWHFVYGNTLVIGLNSCLNVLAPGQSVEGQVDWLRGVLESYADDPDITWRIAHYHHSAYSSSNHEDTERVKETWVPIFEEFDVDLALAGHDHNYERTIPIRAEQPAEDGDGIVHVVAGGFFAPGYSPGNSWYTHVSHHGDKNNYCVIEIDGDRLELTAYDGRGEEVLDSFVIQK